jgi:hypothetical protein
VRISFYTWGPAAFLTGRPAEVGIALGTLLRSAFLPLIMRCNVAPDNRVTEVGLPHEKHYYFTFEKQKSKFRFGCQSFDFDVENSISM